jgi:hypothetical protein
MSFVQFKSQYQQSIQRLACTACGAEANASCNCGKPYTPAAERLAHKDELARQKQKAYRERKKVEKSNTALRNEPPDEETVDADHEEGLRVLVVRGFLNRAGEASELADLGKLKSEDVTDEMIEKAECVAAAWNTVARKLRGMKCLNI